ncbi:MAG: hypothetical protein ACOX6P_01335 [Candidatus Merdivicinus sp.]
MNGESVVETPQVFAATARQEHRIPEEPQTNKVEHEEKLRTPILSESPSTTPILRRSNRMTTVLAVLFLAGIGYGSILSSMLDAETAAALGVMTRGFLEGRAESSFFQIFIRTVFPLIALGGAMFLSGFSAVGHPFSVFLLLFRAVGFGMSMSYFYTALSGTGILLGLLLLLPAGGLSGYALLLACRESLKLSSAFFGAMTKSASLPRKTFRIYSVKFCIIALMLILSALLDAGCTSLVLAFWGNSLR